MMRPSFGLCLVLAAAVVAAAAADSIRSIKQLSGMGTYGGSPSPTYAPGTTTPTPSYGSPSPTYAPGTTTPTPSYGSPSPTYAPGTTTSPAPSYGAPSPTYAPGTTTPTPSYGSPSPSNGHSMSPPSISPPSYPGGIPSNISNISIHGFDFVGNMDNRGYDLVERTCYSSVYQCANLCRNHSGCDGFTFVISGPESVCCYLKKQIKKPLVPFRTGDVGVTYKKQNGWPTIADALAAEPTLSSLNSLMMFAAAYSPRISTLLSSPTANVTVFAPNDAAFENLAFMSENYTAAKLMSGSISYLELILLSHVVPGAYSYADLVNMSGGFLYTLNPQALLQVRELPTGNLMLSSIGQTAANLLIMVLAPENIKGGDSYIHIIDSVIVPLQPSSPAPGINTPPTYSQPPTYTPGTTTPPAYSQPPTYAPGSSMPPAYSQPPTYTPGTTLPPAYSQPPTYGGK